MSLGILSREETKRLGGVCDAESAVPSLSRWVVPGVAVVLVVAALAFGFAVYGTQPGTDDIVAGTLEGAGVTPWFSAGELFSEDMHGWLFALQAGVGAAVVVLCLFWLRRMRCGSRRCAQQRHTIFDEHILDDTAMNSPLRFVPAWLKLVLCGAAIVLAVMSPLPYVPLFVAVVMVDYGRRGCAGGCCDDWSAASCGDDGVACSCGSGAVPDVCGDVLFVFPCADDADDVAVCGAAAFAVSAGVCGSGDADLPVYFCVYRGGDQYS